MKDESLDNAYKRITKPANLFLINRIAINGPKCPLMVLVAPALLTLPLFFSLVDKYGVTEQPQSHLVELRNSGELRDWADDEFASIVSAESDYLLAEASLAKPRCASVAAHEQLAARATNLFKPAQPCMGRAMRVVVVGGKRVGKTAILRQVACFEDITSKRYEPTIDDTYQVLLEEGDRPREVLIFHDTGGISDTGPVELKRPYLQVADAFVLVYSVADHESFNRIDLLKKFIEKQFGKDRKEVPIVALGNMRDLPHRKVDSDFAYSWAARERVKLYEVSAKDRNTLVDFVQYLGQRHFHPIKESKFSLSKKLKSEKSNAAILMDL
ncbi:unnamed protein product [Cylicocyclus nassatus]|uniref:Uncharacterized protein n=1 Tax=Cylicocyclus nassatus TaxID=53992 RepID=A0AA36M2Q6_CYLNA|nr:unnamed protein product [Cylicocyclus nassatus]